MEIDFNELRRNYDALSDKEKDLIRSAMNGPLRVVMFKVFGEEFNDALGSFMQPSKSRRSAGLASRV
tara:strand:- start:1021 stop:1221 length:201 start_codon:yes stop_codon:yes gene_type:complete